jgi:Uncharacterized protein conserved in bacteria
MDFSLTPEELRVLGALVEKSIATPDNYPLSLNALVNACNQLTARDPVVSYDETTVTRALDGLREKRLATLYHGADSRVARYKHTLPDRFVLTPAEIAILCVLMLRGPQTAGELRTRTERLYLFDTLAETEQTLESLITYTPEPLVTKLPRQPGTKESRFAQLLSPPPPPAAERVSVSPPPANPSPSPSLSTPTDADRIAQLERDLAALRAEFAEFKKQFE